MGKIENRLGLSPVLKRLAFHYLKMGVGSHSIDHPVYDEVRVVELYDWHTPRAKDIPPRGGLIVEFCRGGERVRWVEFGCSFIGGGGTPITR